MSEEKSWEQMTISEQMSAARDRQASFRLEADVRAAARKMDLNAKEVEGLVQRAREEFVFVNGEARAMKGKEAVRNERGGLVTIAEWVAEHRTSKSEPDWPFELRTSNTGTFGPSPAKLPEPFRNPYSREGWNLTEQMKLHRRDPELAAKLKQEAA